MNDSDKGLTDSLMGKLGVSIDDLNMEADKDGPKPGLLLLGEQNSRPKEKPVKKWRNRNTVSLLQIENGRDTLLFDSNMDKGTGLFQQ